MALALQLPLLTWTFFFWNVWPDSFICVTWLILTSSNSCSAVATADMNILYTHTHADTHTHTHTVANADIHEDADTYTDKDTDVKTETATATATGRDRAIGRNRQPQHGTKSSVCHQVLRDVNIFLWATSCEHGTFRNVMWIWHYLRCEYGPMCKCYMCNIMRIWHYAQRDGNMALCATKCEYGIVCGVNMALHISLHTVPYSTMLRIVPYYAAHSAIFTSYCIQCHIHIILHRMRCEYGTVCNMMWIWHYAQRDVNMVLCAVWCAHGIACDMNMALCASTICATSCEYGTMHSVMWIWYCAQCDVHMALPATCTWHYVQAQYAQHHVNMPLRATTSCEYSFL